MSEVGDRPFLVFEGPDAAIARFTYAEMDDLVADVAGWLDGAGVTPGSAVHLVLQNSVGFVAVWLACSRLRAWMVPSDPRATQSELTEHLGRTMPVVGVCSPPRREVYSAAVAAAESGTQVVELDEADTELSPLRGRPCPPGQGQPDDRLAVMFTSGTTSAPKGVDLTQANYAFAGDVMAMAAGLNRLDRQLVVLPLFHANAQYYSFAAAISVGASVALVHTFSASRFLEQAQRLEATHASLFAAPIRMILRRAPDDAPRLQLRHAWFAQNLSAAQYAEITRLLGCRPRQLYGMTETLPAVLTNPAVGGAPAAIGVPTLGCHVRVVDAEARPVPVGEPGAIQVAGHPGVTIFRSYLDDPDTTAATIAERRPDGFVWFDTGDRATLDESGLHYFHGRRSDLLKVAGENVSVVEVEHALAEHPAVGDVAVIGVDDDVRDEVPEAYLVLKDGSGSDAVVEIERWAEARLAPAKRPRAYHVVDELPRTSVGKIRKFLLGATPGDGPNRSEQKGDQPCAG